MKNTIKTAAEMGAKAFAEEKPLIPYMDTTFITFLETLPSDQRIPALKAWQGGWIDAPLPE